VEEILTKAKFKNRLVFLFFIYQLRLCILYHIGHHPLILSLSKEACALAYFCMPLLARTAL
jgi:hypothetical protein